MVRQQRKNVQCFSLPLLIFIVSLLLLPDPVLTQGDDEDNFLYSSEEYDQYNPSKNTDRFAEEKALIEAFKNGKPPKIKPTSLPKLPVHTIQRFERSWIKVCKGPGNVLFHATLKWNEDKQRLYWTNARCRTIIPDENEYMFEDQEETIRVTDWQRLTNASDQCNWRRNEVMKGVASYFDAVSNIRYVAFVCVKYSEVQVLRGSRDLQRISVTGSRTIVRPLKENDRWGAIKIHAPKTYYYQIKGDIVVQLISVRMEAIKRICKFCKTQMCRKYSCFGG